MSDTRAALDRSDIVLADTGAVKMWMARLYPTYEPNTCLVSNGLSTMAFALPGAIGAKLAVPGRRVLAAVGDGAFLMNSQEIETALRERVPLTVLIWQDDAYGLIRWKMDTGTRPRRRSRVLEPRFRGICGEFRGPGVRRELGSRPAPGPQRSLGLRRSVGYRLPRRLRRECAAHQRSRSTVRTVLSAATSGHGVP